jgi:hypothetical protein
MQLVSETLAGLVPPQALENPYRRKSILRDLRVLYEA